MTAHSHDFEEAVQEYWPRLCGLCYRLCGDRQEAEDITQEVLLRAYKGWSEFRGESSVGTWLFRIAVNECMRHSKRKTLLKLDELGGQETEACHPMRDAGRDMEMRAESDALNHALEKLSPLRRALVHLAFTEGMRAADIARTLEIPIGSVWSGLHEAKRQLREILAPMLVLPKTGSK